MFLHINGNHWQKHNLWNGRKYLLIIWLRRCYFLKYINSSYNSILKIQTTQLKNGQKTWIDSIPKKTYRWPTGIWKNCSTSLIIREMKIKTTIRYHLTPLKMAIIKKSTNIKYWWGRKENGTLVHCCSECKLVQTLWTTIWKFLQNLKIEPLHDRTIPLVGTYLKKTKNTNLKRYMHSKVHSSTIYNSQDMEAT